MNLKRLKFLALASVTALSLHSEKVDALLAGVKTTGMAATSVAYPVDAFAGAYNPANITNLCNRLDTGISWVKTSQGANIRDLPNYSDSLLLLATGGLNPCSLNGYRDGAKTNSTYVPEFGINKRWCLGYSLCDCPIDISTSLIVYNRNELKTTYGRPMELFGTSRLGLEYIHQTAAFVTAARFLDMHSIGLAVNYNIQRMKIDGLENFSNPLFSDFPESTTNRGYNYSNGVGVVLGYLFQWDCFKAGAAWQPKTKMRRFDKYKGFVADAGRFHLPERYTAGASYRFSCNLAFAFDWEYIRWRQIPQLKNNTFLPPENGNTAFPNISPDPLFGDKKGPGFGWDDQTFYRVGAEYDFNRNISLRVGFRHANSPIRRHWTAANMLTLDCMENVVTFGGTWKICSNQEINIFYALGINHKIRGLDNNIGFTSSNCGTSSEPSSEGSIPTYIRVQNPDPSGPPTILLPINANPDDFPPSITPGNGSVDIHQRRCALGISWGLYF